MFTTRKWWLLLVAALLPLSANADGLLQNRFLASGAGTPIDNIGTAIGFHKLTWNVSGTASVCTVALDTSADGITWSAGGAIAGQTCTSNGSSTVATVVANFVRINMTALTVTPGSSVSVTWTGFVTNPGGGGGGGTITACTTTGGVAYENGTNNTLTCGSPFTWDPVTNGLNVTGPSGQFFQVSPNVFGFPGVTMASGPFAAGSVSVDACTPGPCMSVDIGLGSGNIGGFSGAGNGGWTYNNTTNATCWAGSTSGTACLSTPATGGQLNSNSPINVIADGVHAGELAVVGNTTAPTIPSNSFGFIGPNSASFTSWFIQPTATAPAAVSVPILGITASNISAMTLKGVQGTDANIMTAGTVSGTGAALCTTANGGATTSGCSGGSGIKQMFTSSNTIAIPGNTTQFYAANGVAESQGAIGRASSPILASGTVTGTNFWTYVSTSNAQPATGTLVCTLFSGPVGTMVTTGVSITVTAGGTGLFQGTGSGSVTAGQAAAWSCANNATTNSTAPTSIVGTVN